MSAEIGAPSDMLAAHPETAYFWGRVAGDGDCEDGCVTVRTTDEAAADRLVAIAGAERTDRRTVERNYAHDTSVTRREDEYTVQVLGPLAERASGALGLPFDGESGGYRLDPLTEYDRELLRGLVEACGTVCFKADDDAVGLSFVHEDRTLLSTVQSLLDGVPVTAPYGEPSAASSGHWFGVDDAAVPAVGDWLYEGSEATGLFAPSRRRKLEQSIERVR
ncbi:cobalamin biosynthesis protein [Haloarcula nitratireducens]|uniref:Cobalamin biosynthesis protein n=1 Tax=Haloarcula nitratireducens TaxID=2487749 RepID=A0AAW4PI49_9EURY|nr:cobalamin biosynthesis protein [Halomicroarcula nitratireducens]MBX0297313.1 cobalamin biosynthesis protein [Halomicroarcula nitratireducens]